MEIFWTPGITLEELEKLVIIRAFSYYQKNKTMTASALGIAIRTLDSKLEKYDNERREQEKRDSERTKQQNDFLARQRGPHQSILAPEGVLVGSSNAALEPASGVRMEPTAQTGTEPPVSMPERKEVQKVLPAQAPAGGARARR